MEIPQSWREALKRVHALGFPEAIIGGGALRDLEHGAEVKDIDIFLTAKPFMRAQLEQAFGTHARVVVTGAATEYLQFSDDVVEVLEFANPEGPPFQVIISTPPVNDEDFLEYQLERFDIGLCRIAYDGEGIIRHGTYLEDRDAKVLRIRDPRRIPRSLVRAERIKAKYPNHKIVDPDGKEHVPFTWAEAI